MSLNDIIKSAIYASANGVAVLVSMRYVGRILDKIEKSKGNGHKAPSAKRPKLPPKAS